LGGIVVLSARHATAGSVSTMLDRRFIRDNPEAVKAAVRVKGIDLDVDNLYVRQAQANDGPRLKRIRPAPMGRAYRYQRRMTHIVLSVAERRQAEGLVTKVEEPAAGVEASKTALPKAKKAAPKKTAAKKPAAKAGGTKKKAAKKS